MINLLFYLLEIGKEALYPHFLLHIILRGKEAYYTQAFLIPIFFNKKHIYKIVLWH